MSYGMSIFAQHAELLALRPLGKRTPANGGTAYEDYKIVLRNGDGSPKNARTTAAQHDAPPPEFDDDFGPGY